MHQLSREMAPWGLMRVMAEGDRRVWGSRKEMDPSAMSLDSCAAIYGEKKRDLYHIMWPLDPQTAGALRAGCSRAPPGRLHIVYCYRTFTFVLQRNHLPPPTCPSV